MTSVRDLLDIAAGEIDVVSCRLSLREGPSAEQVAASWSALLPAVQHLVLQTAGRRGLPDRTIFDELAALKPPETSFPAAAPALVRAARAMGAAGDLLSTSPLQHPRGERLSLYGEARELLTATAEVTLHGLGRTFEHGEVLTSVAAAGTLARRLPPPDRAGAPAPQRYLAEIAVPAPVVPRNHPLRLLDDAVLEWTRLATCLPRSPALSSRDLRGATLVAGHVVAAARALVATGAPDATAPTDLALHLAGQAWSAAGSCWSKLELPGRPEPALVSASWSVVRQVRDLFRDGQRLAAETPATASALRERLLRGLSAVAKAHLAAVTEAAGGGHVVARRRTMRQSHQGLTQRRFDWVAAPDDAVRELLSSYHDVAASLRRSATNPVISVTYNPVQRDRSRAQPRPCR